MDNGGEFFNKRKKVILSRFVGSVVNGVNRPGEDLISGIMVHEWFSLFRFCNRFDYYEVHTKDNSYGTHVNINLIAWPDGKSCLEQDMLMMSIFECIRGEWRRKVNGQ